MDSRKSCRKDRQRAGRQDSKRWQAAVRQEVRLSWNIMENRRGYGNRAGRQGTQRGQASGDRKRAGRQDIQREQAGIGQEVGRQAGLREERLMGRRWQACRTRRSERTGGWGGDTQRVQEGGEGREEGRQAGHSERKAGGEGMRIDRQDTQKEQEGGEGLEEGRQTGHSKRT